MLSQISNAFLEHEGLLPCSQEPITGPCPESDDSNPHPPDFPKIILILSSHLCQGLLSGLFPSDFPSQHFICIYLPHVHYISYASHTP